MLKNDYIQDYKRKERDIQRLTIIVLQFEAKKKLILIHKLTFRK